MLRFALGLATAVATLAMGNPLLVESPHEIKWSTKLETADLESGGWSKFAPDGSIYLSGSSLTKHGEEFGPSGALFLHLNADGSRKNLVRNEGNEESYGGSVSLGKNGRIYCSETSRGERPYECLVRARDTAGVTVWTARFGSADNDAILALAVDSVDSVLAVGWTYGSLAAPNAGHFDALVAKYTANGQPVWIRQFGGGGGDGAMGVAIDKEDNVYVSGTTHGQIAEDTPTEKTNYNSYLRKYDNNGALVWERVYETSSQETFCKVVIGPDDRLVLVDRSEEYVANSPTKYRSELRKVAGHGTLVWEKCVTTDSFLQAADLAIDERGNIFLAGYSPSRDPAIANFNPDGELHWESSTAKDVDASINSIDVDAAGNLLLSGDLRTPKRNSDVFVTLLAPVKGK